MRCRCMASVWCVHAWLSHSWVLVLEPAGQVAVLSWAAVGSQKIVNEMFHTFMQVEDSACHCIAWWYISGQDDNRVVCRRCHSMWRSCMPKALAWAYVVMCQQQMWSYATPDSTLICVVVWQRMNSNITTRSTPRLSQKHWLSTHANHMTIIPMTIVALHVRRKHRSHSGFLTKFYTVAECQITKHKNVAYHQHTFKRDMNLLDCCPFKTLVVMRLCWVAMAAHSICLAHGLIYW